MNTSIQLLKRVNSTKYLVPLKKMIVAFKFKIDVHHQTEKQTKNQSM